MTNNIYELLESSKSSCEQKPLMRARIFEAVEIEDKERTSIGAPRFPLSPSQALKPMRDLYYELCNYYNPGSIPKNDIPAQSKLLFENGYVVEDLLKKYVKKAYEVIAEQQYVTFGQIDGLLLGGSIDWAIKLDNEIVICDSKSSGDFPFKQVPKEDNIAQMQLYMHSKWARDNNINRSILIYYNKNNSDIKCIEVRYNPEIAQQLVKRFEQVYTFYKAGTLPAREFIIGCDWRANYSSYRSHDFSEFKLPLFKRNIIRGIDKLAISAKEGSKEEIRQFALQYGNNLVQVDNKSFYLWLKDDESTLILRTKGEE